MANNLLELLLVSDRALQLEVNTLESQLQQLQQIKQQLNIAREQADLAAVELNQPSGIPTADAILKLLKSAQGDRDCTVTSPIAQSVEAAAHQAVEAQTDQAVAATANPPTNLNDSDDLGADQDLWQAINSI